MAERVVLAELDFEEGPAVAAQENLQRGLVGLEGGAARSAQRVRSEWDNTGNLFTRRMFSMRLAAVAFLGSFTVGGIIIGLKSLFSEAIRTDERFKEFNATMAVFHGRLVSVAADLLEVSGALEAMSAMAIRTSALMEFLENRGKGVASTMKTVGTNIILFALPGLRAAFEGGKELLAVFDKLLAPEIAKVQADIAAKLAVPVKIEFIRDFRPAIFLQNWQAVMDAMHGGLRIVEQDVREADMTLREMAVGFELYGNAAAAASELVSAASASGLLANSAAARLMMAILAVQSVQRGMFEVAAAVASAAALDFRGAALHKLAAGLFFATAAFQGAAAFGAGPGAASGGASGGRGGASGAFAPEVRSAASQNVTFVLEGSVIGLGMSRDEFVAWINEQLRVAQRHNA